MQSIEFCAGAGGQALGLEQAGYDHAALVEIEADYCKTLRLNRPKWDVRCADMNGFDGRSFKGVELMAGGLPCPPFSVAGKQLGDLDERNLFPAALRLIDEINPKAVMIENVRGFLSPVFEEYRLYLKAEFEKLGYVVDWRLLNASDFGVSQLRPRVVIVALKRAFAAGFEWPEVLPHNPPTVGEVLKEMMAANGWPGAARWAKGANDIAPTIVGGSKKHGGPDLGPTRARTRSVVFPKDPHYQSGMTICLAEQRRAFHADLCQELLVVDEGIASNADGSQAASVRIALSIADALGAKEGKKLAGQTAGHKFEHAVERFLKATFGMGISGLRPGIWSIDCIRSRSPLVIAQYEQYSHLADIRKIADDNPDLAAAIGLDYAVASDIVVARLPESDEAILAAGLNLDDSQANASPIRKTRAFFDQSGSYPQELK